MSAPAAAGRVPPTTFFLYVAVDSENDCEK